MFDSFLNLPLHRLMLRVTVVLLPIGAPAASASTTT